MKTDNDSNLIKGDGNRRFEITLDTINLFLSLAVIIISLISLGAEDSPKLMKRLIFLMMGIVAALNVGRFYHERPGISAVCLLLAAVLVTLAVLI